MIIYWDIKQLNVCQVVPSCTVYSFEKRTVISKIVIVILIRICFIKSVFKVSSREDSKSYEMTSP